MIGVVLVFSILAVIALAALGIAAEARQQTVGAILAAFWRDLLSLKDGFAQARRDHPNPMFAMLETGFLLFMLLPLLDHVLDPEFSTTAAWVWWLTIAQHEIGHVVCSPFGTFLRVAGGSIWQILFWILLGQYALMFRGQIGVFVLCWIVAGHSFINLSVYIRDARTRELPLLFGHGKEAHDWWNLLRWTGLLEYDHIIADMAVVIGVLIVMCMIFLGILAVWFLPRGSGQRAHGYVLRALMQSIQSRRVIDGEIVG